MALPDYLTALTDKDIRREHHADDVIESTDFWPAIYPAEFSRCFDVDDSFAPQRRIEKLVAAVHQINMEANESACSWVRCGYETLTTVPQVYTDIKLTTTPLPAIDADTDTEAPAARTVEIQPLVFAYRSAVYCFAMYLLCKRYRATDTTDAADDKALTMEARAEEWRVEYFRHINTLTGADGAESEVAVI